MHISSTADFHRLEFLYYTLSDFGVPVSGKNKSTLLLDLSKFVTSRGLKGLTTVLILDEAHHLSTELLEEIRLLSNLETNDDKLLQIVLVGQPELDDKLDSFELRPLKQRIALRAPWSPGRRRGKADTSKNVCGLPAQTRTRILCFRRNHCGGASPFTGFPASD